MRLRIAGPLGAAEFLLQDLKLSCAQGEFGKFWKRTAARMSRWRRRKSLPSSAGRSPGAIRLLEDLGVKVHVAGPISPANSPFPARRGSRRLDAVDARPLRHHRQRRHRARAAQPLPPPPAFRDPFHPRRHDGPGRALLRPTGFGGGRFQRRPGLGVSRRRRRVRPRPEDPCRPFRRVFQPRGRALAPACAGARLHRRGRAHRPDVPASGLRPDDPARGCGGGLPRGAAVGPAGVHARLGCRRCPEVPRERLDGLQQPRARRSDGRGPVRGAARSHRRGAEGAVFRGDPHPLSRALQGGRLVQMGAPAPSA